MRQELDVEVKDYKIIITDDEISKLIDELGWFTDGQKRLFVISERVYKLYNEVLNIDKLELLVLKDGEQEKNFKNYIKILTKAEELGLRRTDVIIAIGGGVIGDIAGFAAATYMRGIDYIQVPTTLLSMVDSSVGGKTAIDLGGVKNIVGAFYQPKRVYIYTKFLETLDKRQFFSGMGEVLKYAFIEDNCGYKHPLYLFEYLTLSVDKFLNKDSMTLMRAIEYCLNLKIAVVNQDEKEAGLRKILNLGHTIGHALEAKGNFRKYTHGEAVVQGIFFIMNYAYSKGYITYSYYRLSTELLEKYGFKSQIVKKGSELLKFIKRDKKATSKGISFIVPSNKKRVKEINLTLDEVSSLF